MKIRPQVWAASLFIAGVSLCGFQISTRLSQAQAPFDPAAPSPWSAMSPEQKKTYDERNRQYREAMRKAISTAYEAKENNGSKRRGLTVQQLPLELREKAREIADQYRNEIYPALAKYVEEHDGRVPNVAAGTSLTGVPAAYTADTEYKGTGPYMYSRGSWSIGSSWRLDGTFTSRDLYSKNPDSAPHDVWARYTKFENSAGKGLKFCIRGWDDGKVTFDDIRNDYYAIIPRPIGSVAGTAAPGQAGIPETAKSGVVKLQGEEAHHK